MFWISIEKCNLLVQQVWSRGHNDSHLDCLLKFTLSKNTYRKKQEYKLMEVSIFSHMNLMSPNNNYWLPKWQMWLATEQLYHYQWLNQMEFTFAKHCDQAAVVVSRPDAIGQRPDGQRPGNPRVYFKQAQHPSKIRAGWQSFPGVSRAHVQETTLKYYV